MGSEKEQQIEELSFDSEKDILPNTPVEVSSKESHKELLVEQR
jgi:hypothetical protein